MSMGSAVPGLIVALAVRSGVTAGSCTVRLTVNGPWLPTGKLCVTACPVDDGEVSPHCQVYVSSPEALATWPVKLNVWTTGPCVTLIRAGPGGTTTVTPA